MIVESIQTTFKISGIGDTLGDVEDIKVVTERIFAKDDDFIRENLERMRAAVEVNAIDHIAIHIHNSKIR